MIKGNRGQLSIFMGITLILVMGMLAFIVNVGLFVKAKINLQNATDAAAYAGAATQARQLTNIAYVNWEMRNTYKEWMFKYYVLGQLGLFPYNLAEDKLTGGQIVSFKLPTPPVSGATFKDLYNVPSICIHNNSKTNICPIFSLPGIPRFAAIGVAGISEIHEAFVDKLAEEKGKDCSIRSKMNYLTALTWAYGSGKEDMPEAPLIATNRPGAWPEALELAMRMRNLEMIVNRPAIAKITRQSVVQLQNVNGQIGLNERPLKAFWSAYRNLSGGAYKDNKSNDELTRNFELSELAPNPFLANPLSASGFLIPDKFSYGDSGIKATSKQYLDLQLMPLNLATMFSTFADTATNNAGMDGVVMDATCGVSKTAMPVPGYIMGFVKNPKVLTYYAVKAQSKFIGLFAPFRGDIEAGITLTAYAAAKPFGGRIGPHLFSFDKANQAALLARDGDKNKRSAAYVSGLIIDKTKTAFEPGMPIPFDTKNFWVDDQFKAIGGIPENGNKVFYSIPNMIYDFEQLGDLNKQSITSTNIQYIDSAAATQPPFLGLYQGTQLKALKDSIGTVNPGTSMSGQSVLEAIIRARRATKYDAMNYLIPSFGEVSEKNNVAPIVIKKDPISQVGFSYKLFAPLTGQGLLYEAADVESVVGSYIKSNDEAIKQYLQALLEVGNSIYKISHGGGASGVGDTTAAARSIHVNAGILGAPSMPNLLVGAAASDPACKSDMASKFNHFFNGTMKACDVTPLTDLMIEFIQERSTNPERSLYYIGFYYDENSPLRLKPEQLMSAYYPGARQGVDTGDSALNEHPLKISSADSSDKFSTRRNFYSTKFIQLSKVVEGKTDNDGKTPALSERGDGEIPADFNGIKVENLIKYDATNGINKNYFLDF